MRPRDRRSVVDAIELGQEVHLRDKTVSSVGREVDTSFLALGPMHTTAHGLRTRVMFGEQQGGREGRR
jgi:hypothetical protein